MSAPMILDAFGRTARSTYGSAYKSPVDASGASSRTVQQPRMDQDSWRLVPAHVHKQMLSDSRNIAKDDMVRGMVLQKSDYVGAAGWMPSYAGSNPNAGVIYEAWLEQFFKICNVRGELFDFATMMDSGCEALDVDGDFFTLLTETETGFPQYQSFEAHRIHSRPGQIIVTRPGQWFGRSIVCGIVYDAYGREEAYQVLGDTEDQDVLVAAGDMVRGADMHRPSEGRPLSPVSYALHKWYNYRDCQDNELQAQRITSSITILEKNEDGMAPDLRAELTSEAGSAAAGPTVGELAGGLYKYVKSGSGSLEAFLSNRPSSEVAAFWQSVSASAAFGMEWRIEMMDLSRLGGAGVRGFADNINTVIRARWLVLVRHAQRLVRWAIAKAIKRGDLPPDDDWWMWDFPQPPEFTVDAGRSVTADIDAIRAGLDCEENIVASRLGTTLRRLLNKRAKGYVLKQEIAKEHGISVAELGYLTRPGDGAAQIEQAVKATGEPTP